MDERRDRERMNGMMMCMNPMHANNVPWMTITRHGSALVFYLYAVTQWPGNTVPNVFLEDQRVFGYNLTSWLFTLLIWSAFLYHYAVSWGRVEIIFKKGEVRARGWVVKKWKRLHRVFMSLALACSLLTLAQSVTLEMVYTGFGNHDHPKFYLHLELLKIDQLVSLSLFVYILFRVIFEPNGLKRYKRNLAKVKVLEVEENDSDLNIEVSVEECAICVSKWANRRLSCGHLLCCCCLMEISTNSYTSTLCPFCRAEIRKIGRLKVLSSDDVTFRDCCSAPSMDELVNRIANQEL